MKAITERQHQVLEQVATGKPNKEIAFDLGISIKTVEKHRDQINKRLETHSGAEACVKAMRMGILQ